MKVVPPTQKRSITLNIFNIIKMSMNRSSGEHREICAKQEIEKYLFDKIVLRERKGGFASIAVHVQHEILVNSKK